MRTSKWNGAAGLVASDHVRLRPAGPSDSDGITAVFLASRGATMPYLPKLHSDQETQAWIEAVVLRECTVWVAETADPAEIVGFAALQGSVLDHLYLRPDVTRQGIGSMLLEAVRGASPEELSLHVFQRNEAARAFYEHHGFEAGEFNDGSRNEESEPDVSYHWHARGADAPAEGA
ncbi:GNAT family N-acetyltransferase [Streptomyces caniscabiei]|uniref:GNAT family N-acetyltransferase n=1 Tax=Streptomyces caniscabiei TaxID=2746961 RepID=A0ABU4N030_9ACTN|nr:GNAT family N-acetyltransferase [Streptomyces caniscabiei]MBE4741680.1 GNAT family N-acetyltransferase [Streptomyces caniscabiei]MBE4762026.1 GNAT family N-acetyltransferase [Streptomyces caniscabiei]MBE4775327.1 GNAT family N-acetyltransferase [Streptomyces caniscabiei]MBE4790490.1 GNAT family N-acetyltransferase [Streptomyces caniscabiei]MBE4799647.1 GNAT family N-acetyltransferase [Streptomyces caniscabiei]